MSEDTIVLTRRRLLGGLVAIGGASAATGASTMATFLDTESSTDNSISAGTLDLKLDGGDTTVRFLSDTTIVPGEEYRSKLKVRNAGSVPGYIDIDVDSLTTWENGCVQVEEPNSVDKSCGDPGEGEGELQEYLEVKASFENGQDDTSSIFGWGDASTRLDPNESYDLDYQLNGGESVWFVLEYELPSLGDDAKSDGIEFALTFSLDQEEDSGV